MSEGTMETRTIASLLCTAANFSISVSDLTRTILNSEDPFWVEYVQKGGKINADLFVPKSELEAFAIEMASNVDHDAKNGKEIYNPINFNVVEELNMPCPPEANGAHRAGTGLIHVFDENMTPLMDGEKHVYEMDEAIVKESFDKFNEKINKNGSLSLQEVQAAFEERYHVDLEKKTTTDMNLAKTGDFYVTTYCRIIVPEGELQLGRDGVQVNADGTPIYKQSYLAAAEKIVNNHHGGRNLTAPNWSEETDIMRLATAKSNDSMWVGKDTRIIPNLNHEQANLLSKLAKDNHVGFLMLQDKETKEYSLEVLDEVTKTDAFAQTMAEYELLQAHPSYAAYMRNQRREMTAILDVLDNIESIDESSVLLISNDPSHNYVRITDTARDSAETQISVTIHGLNDDGKPASRIINLQEDKNGYRDLVGSIEALGDFTLIRGDKACNEFESKLREEGIDGIKDAYSHIYSNNSNKDNLVAAVKTAVEENVTHKDLTFGENEDMQFRIPNSDKLVRTIAKNITNEKLSAEDKLQAMQTAINEESTYLHITPVSSHVASASYNLRDFGMLVLDDRNVVADQEMLKAMTPQEIANYNESASQGANAYQQEMYDFNSAQQEYYDNPELSQFDPEAEYNASKTAWENLDDRDYAEEHYTEDQFVDEWDEYDIEPELGGTDLNS